MPLVVSDTSPIRALAHLGLLDLLPALYGPILAPPAVAQELLRPRTTLPVVDLSLVPFIRVQAPNNSPDLQRLLGLLDAGEAEALALAVEVSASILLIDERAGRAEGTRLGLAVVGTLGALLRAKQRGLVPAVGPLMDRLVNAINFFIAPPLRAAVLRLAGEAPTP
jgi:predicted nucleic acid-binding protein